MSERHASRSSNDHGIAQPVTGSHGTEAPIPADSPIEHRSDDTIGRADLAARFADQVLGQDARKGIVVGVLGPWGSGKTSFINLARERFASRETAILDFNPWMFSGAQGLVTSFFIELSAQLKLRPDLAEIGLKLEDYGESFSGLGWLPLVGPWIERGRLVSKLLTKLMQRRKEGIGGRRQELHQALQSLDSPILVVLDDIDRLETAEIRDVFKLVRLTASFPNMIYLVSFDRHRVEQALSEEGVPGRDYLEKIIQIGVDLPPIPEDVLTRQITTALDDALRTVENPGHLDAQVWPDIFMEVIRPLVRNMRDVRRYALAVQSTVSALRGEVSLADVLALEAVRVFMPDVFVELHRSVEALTRPSPEMGLREPESLKERVIALIEADRDREEVVSALVRRLFPAAQRHLPGGMHYGASWSTQWLRQRRVANREILRFYLERIAGRALQAFREAERAWELLGDEAELDAYLRGLDRERLEDVIAALESYEDEFRPHHVVPATTVLLNILPELPERERGMFELDSRFVVGRVVYRLFRVFGNPQDAESAARQVLPRLKSLSSKLELITDVGHRENAGHKFVTEAAAGALEKEWRNEVRAATPSQLAEEHDLLRVFFIAKQEVETDEGRIDVPAAPNITRALLESSRSDARSQSIESRAVRRSPRLAWDVLISVYGDESTVARRIEELKDSNIQVDGALIALAEKYVKGWRPDDWGDSED